MTGARKQRRKAKIQRSPATFESPPPIDSLNQLSIPLSTLDPLGSAQHRPFIQNYGRVRAQRANHAEYLRALILAEKQW